MQLLRDLNTKEKKTVVMVTHDLEYLKYANRAIKIFDGRVEATYTENQINDLIGSSQNKRGVSVAEKVLGQERSHQPDIISDTAAPTLKFQVESIDDVGPAGQKSKAKTAKIEQRPKSSRSQA